MHCIIKTFDQFIINHIVVKSDSLVTRRLSGKSYEATLQFLSNTFLFLKIPAGFLTDFIFLQYIRTLLYKTYYFTLKYKYSCTKYLKTELFKGKVLKHS